MLTKSPHYILLVPVGIKLPKKILKIQNERYPSKTDSFAKLPQKFKIPDFNLISIYLINKNPKNRFTKYQSNQTGKF